MCLAVAYTKLASKIQKRTKLGVKESLTEASLGWKCFGIHNKIPELYTFKNKYVDEITKKSIKVGMVCAYNRYFESEHFDQRFLTIRKYLDIYDKEISSVIGKNLEEIAIKEKEYQTSLIGDETDYCRIDEMKWKSISIKTLENFILVKTCRR